MKLCLLGRFCLGTMVLVVLAVQPAQGTLIFYSSRTSFEADNPGLPVETFEASQAPDFWIIDIEGPVNSGSNNAAFNPGDILPGISFIDDPLPSILLATGTDLFPGSTKGLLGDTDADSLEMSFSPGVAAVGFDLGGALPTGSITPGTITISIYGTSGLLGTTDVATTGINFWGVVSDSEPITRINLHSQDNRLEYIDNVAFGTSDITAIPEPTSMLLFLAGGAGLGVWRWRR